jgi:hypothetical protein
MTFALSWGVVLVPPIVVALLDEICADNEVHISSKEIHAFYGFS